MCALYEDMIKRPLLLRDLVYTILASGEVFIWEYEDVICLESC
jgi:hypothetical protein